uniref:Uncharacterized protein n=1 Tax=Odontella aurita TaxID=265563 RepID=A0A7S4I4E9_9STRA|mmetsp:Transcript_19800/g.57457  ORF Transcript_19800/g.57457 Transcript_19800/m.57457 type:complete len:219 (+) Transcript_19800:314-970(+)|eukprot:CAMPEP_0113529204 /NCGR_PEP_ID=MMETSP0015_2-20120614/2267_1 /TAXON_ID=2838 /ORGANISM="Odontella" /LENGTH=218 /DNA_ID=CAMNT_0000427815 /DNA_START=183 /DNA_END=839 /DNA_ORIENTATION=+ /assembly_acc=CAM_ASM_000160
MFRYNSLLLLSLVVETAGAFSPAVKPAHVSQPLDSDLLRSQLGAASSFYSLRDEHEILCPSTGDTRGFLCTIEPPSAGNVGDVGARSIANIPDVARHVGIAGSVAAGLQSQNWGQCYYLASEALLRRSSLPNAVPDSWLEDARAAGKCLIYAVNTASEKFSATSDVYVASPEDPCGDAWRLSVDYKVSHVNPSLFPSSVPVSPKIRLAGAALRQHQLR